MPPYQVPATGIIDYVYPALPTGLTRDTWVRRVVVLPSSEAVTHHALAFLEPFDNRRPAGLSADDWVGVFSPGVNLSTGGIADSSRGDAALLLPARSTVYLQVHYTTVGKPVSNTIRVGIYFHKGTPAYRIRTMGIASDVRIPPGASDHAASASHTLKEDIVLYGLYPHMHYRGSRAKSTLDTPGKGSEVLLSVPRYRFNWQTIYYLAEPRRVPAGATMHFTGAFDNSSDNPLNPDPTKTVTFGNQSWDECSSAIWSMASPRAESGVSTPAPGSRAPFVQELRRDQLDGLRALLFMCVFVAHHALEQVEFFCTRCRRSS